MKWVLSLLICFSASAQLPVIPYVIPNSTISANLTGVAYRWWTNGLALNVALTGGWTDQVQSLVWTNGASANRPTNSLNGVWFDNTHWMTNVGMTGMGSNFALAFICNIQDLTFWNGTAHGTIISSQNGTGTKEMRFGGEASPGNDSMCITTAGVVQNQITQLSPFRATNTFVDILFNQVVTNGNIWSMYFYTNGVLDKKLNFSGGGAIGNGYIGTTDATILTPNYFGVLCHLLDNATGPRMYISEIWGWTNGAPGDVNGAPLPPALLSAFHTYATNKYRFSP